ncbi:3-oxoacyl-ACP reductase FabG [Jeotgalibacillus campisalis]|uniref:3-oxoacyl-[acyl-carrier-protein] reductase n=1 Tax=Jeotgalibacillus campisalis TaxID=220754 RepID=A0A0C2WAS1_9BACL|nr:3-oxoacyl-ACP reductase FabG [Jeotgalibacillus campisalis]KIL53143.1 3-oxoacyl-[acyl-carrier-protein] reductase [Jeotgalibacillus campisalis]
MRLQDKVALITGGASGIGKAATELFLEQGARVVIADYNQEQGEQLISALEHHQANVVFCRTDVSKADQAKAAVAFTIEQYGRLDILINNAGITRDAMFTKMTEEQFDEVLDINVKGLFHMTQAALPYLIKQGAGKIINTSSVSGVYGNVGQTNYAASKAAVIGMTKSWAKELGRKGIQVNAVAPGFTATPMVAKMPDNILDQMKSIVSLKRLAEPRDIANAYLFLASDEADYVHGHVLHVDGGIMM